MPRDHARALGLLVIAGCAGMGAAGGGTSSGALEIGQPMPDVVVHTLAGGRELRLGALRGRVVLLDVWASWCEPCREEMPLLDDIAARLKDDGVEVVAVSVDDDRAKAEEFARMRRRWRLTLAHDPAGAIADRLQPAAMPTAYVVDRDGRLREVATGFSKASAAQLEARLRALASRGSRER